MSYMLHSDMSRTLQCCSSSLSPPVPQRSLYTILNQQMSYFLFWKGPPNTSLKAPPNTSLSVQTLVNPILLANTPPPHLIRLFRSITGQKKKEKKTRYIEENIYTKYV